MADIDDEDVVEVLFARCLNRMFLKAATEVVPSTEQAWVGWCELERIYARRLPIRCTPRTFRARLDYHDLYGFWIIPYSVCQPPRERCRSLCHELFEFLAALDILAHLSEYEKSPPNLPHLVAVRAVDYCCDGGQCTLPLATARATINRREMR